VLIAWILAGLLAGLLVNYLADVLPQTRRLSRPLWLSKDKELLAYLLIPRVLFVQFFFLAAAIYLFKTPPYHFPSYLFFVILMYFGLVTFIDIEHRIVMHPVSIAGAVLMAAIGIWRHGWALTLIGAAAGFTLMLALYFVGDLLGRGLARLRKQPWAETALGLGDVNLAAVIGLLMGWPGVLAALAVGIALAGVYSLVYVFLSLLRGNYRLFAAIPYAPFMCVGTVILVAASIYR
jgi:leader peptidase (prepilin peptidase)/N-methyltransferase